MEGNGEQIQNNMVQEGKNEKPIREIASTEPPVKSQLTPSEHSAPDINPADIAAIQQKIESFEKSKTHEQAIGTVEAARESFLDRFFLERPDARRQFEWDITMNTDRYAQMFEKLYATFKRTRDTEEQQKFDNYIRESREVFGMFGIQVRNDGKGRYTIDVPDALRAKVKERGEEGAIKKEYLDLEKNYARVSIQTRNVWREGEYGKARVQQQYLVVDGTQKQFRDIMPGEDWNDSDKDFARQWAQLQDLQYEFFTNDTADEPYHIWYQLKKEDLERMKDTIPPALLDQLKAEGITPEDLNPTNTRMKKEDFDRVLRIKDLISAKTVSLTAIHGWMGDAGVMEDVVVQGLEEAQDLVEEGKIVVGIATDTDGIHGNLADKIPGLREGRKKLTVDVGACQSEYVLNNFFGLAQNGGTILGWSRGGARAQELHARLARLGAKGWKYLYVTPAMEHTAVFEKDQPGQKWWQRLLSTGSRTLLRTTKTMHQLEVSDKSAGRALLEAVGPMYAGAILPGDEIPVQKAREIHERNVTDKNEVAVMALQDKALKEYTGLTSENEGQIVASQDAEDSWAMTIKANNDRLVGKEQLEAATARHNLGNAVVEYDGSHAVMLEEQFLKDFPLGLIIAATPKQLHQLQRRWEELQVLPHMGLPNEDQELLHERIFKRIDSIFFGVPRLADSAKEGIKHLMKHLGYYDVRGKGRLEAAKLKMHNRLRRYQQEVLKRPQQPITA